MIEIYAMQYHMRIILFILSMTVSACLSYAGQEDGQEWALVKIPVACIRDGKSHASEMTSQVIMGTPLQIIEDDEEWIKIKAPDGYEGYINISGLSRKSSSEIAEWRSRARMVVVSKPEIKIYNSEKDKQPRNVVSELVLSSIVEGTPSGKEMSKVVLPDGRTGYVSSKHLMPINDWAVRSLDMDSVVNTAYWLLGTPYLWGACSTKSVDCSGLVRVAYFDRAVLTLRDAREQIGIGQRIEQSDTCKLQKGDLLFFSTTPDGRISHVAIYDENGRYIHSSGLVKTNEMKIDDPDFGKRFYRGASRINGMEGSRGIIRVKDHPWYFNLDK